MVFTPKQMILTAGPKRSRHEVQYVTDAVKNGWNFHHSDYLKKFEAAFSKYLGVKYAVTMPTGTSALHLALVLFGVGPGNEVIVPDLTYIACANAIHYTGATPVFVDVDRITWSIDVTKLEKAITKRTKAIMPVHLYGNMADMPAIMKIAGKYKLPVIEDACEGLGCDLNGKPCGTHGDAAAFSFQGAKLISIGEGGMLTFNRRDWYERALSLVDHGVDFKRQFWHKEIGYMYPMSNIQAALGLARFEEIDDLVQRKRRIFGWYKERLGNIPGLSFNPERQGLESSYWMSSIVLENKFRLTRDQLRRELKKRSIDTRPFFYPQTAFGLYQTNTSPRQELSVSAPNSVSYCLSARGLNLPSGVLRTESEIDYVARTVRKLLVGKL